jgi:hypothetical protein
MELHIARSMVVEPKFLPVVRCGGVSMNVKFDPGYKYACSLIL